MTPQERVKLLQEVIEHLTYGDSTDVLITASKKALNDYRWCREQLIQLYRDMCHDQVSTAERTVSKRP